MWRRHFERRAFQKISNVKFSFGGGWVEEGREGGRAGEGEGEGIYFFSFFLFSFLIVYFYCLVE